MKRKKKQALTRANLVLSPDSAVDSTGFVLVSNKILPAWNSSEETPTFTNTLATDGMAQ